MDGVGGVGLWFEVLWMWLDMWSEVPGTGFVVWSEVPWMGVGTLFLGVDGV